jgi:apoptosis-inducing factor 3
VFPVECWKVEQHAGQIFVKEKRAQPKPRRAATTNGVGRIVIVGGGAAGFAAAEMLRRRGFGGSISILSQDHAAPVDRPNLSKDYLAGTAPEDWLPLRPDAFYTENDIDLRLDTSVVGINVRTREVVLADGESLIYDRLLLATGAEPVRLPVPGADQPHVHTLRSLADCRAIIRTTQNARRALVIGASFFGLEAAAALRARDIEIHVVAPEARPMERILGPGMGDFIQALHEEHGVVFHLKDTVTAINGSVSGRSWTTRSATAGSGGPMESGETHPNDVLFPVVLTGTAKSRWPGTRRRSSFGWLRSGLAYFLDG